MEVRGQGRPERQNKNHQFWVGAATGPGLFLVVQEMSRFPSHETSRHFVGSFTHPEAWGIHDPILTSTHFLEGGIG